MKDNLGDGEKEITEHHITSPTFEHGVFMSVVEFETSISIACGDYVIEKGIIDSVNWEKHKAEHFPRNLGWSEM